MSQHIFESRDRNGVPITITMGYDRPLDYAFCTVMAENDEILYSNLDDENAGTEQQDVEYFRPVLDQLGVSIPESMFRDVASDQRLRVGNRVLIHTAGA
jgi:hypothetical protein